MAQPMVTRLRYISSKNPDKLIMFLDKLGMRVQIYGCPQWDGVRWVLWFVPQDDVMKDVKSTKLD